ncbi:MAG: winged helix-turn-helix transcriptional regulator [Candidatus Eremiobacteraeota bacterium]|nr:winged helix-turn-helix transcriptional regulator [Candidatus Eremiobacteraeota bacterium]
MNFHQELALLSRGRRAFREAMARRFVGKPFVMRADLTDRSRAEALARLLRETAARDCDEVLAGFCDVLEEFFARCLASQWDFFEAAALRDARARESLLHRFGLTSALRTLTRELTATGDRTRTSLEFGGAASEGKRLDFPPDGTVLLTPSYFIWPHAAFVLMRGETVDFRVAYPIASPARVERRVGHWDASAKRFTALADPTRLRMLELLSYRDLSTREFAGVLGISEAGASRHLSILREAALVSAKRDSYFVLYRRTAIARAIVRAVLTPRE